MRLSRRPQRLGGLALGVCLAASVSGARVYGQAPLIIKDIQVEGTETVATEGILDAFNDRLKPGDPFNPQNAEDMTKLRDALNQVARLGFFEAVTHRIETLPDGVRIIIQVVERPRIRRIIFVGNTLFTDDELREAIVSREGAFRDETTVRNDKERLNGFYVDHGYMATVNTPRLAPGEDARDLQFVINEVRIEDIVIEGLHRTRLSTVMNRMRVKPGDLFDQQLLGRDIERIYRLDVFEDVVPDIRAGVREPARAIIVALKCTEKRTGQLSGGIGWNSLDKFVGSVSIAEANFRGRAERVSLSYEAGGRQGYDFSYTAPALNRQGLSGEFSVYDTQRNRRFLSGTTEASTLQQTFTEGGAVEERRRGFNLAVSQQVSEGLMLSLRVRSEKVTDPFFQAAREISVGGGAAGGGLDTTVHAAASTRSSVPSPNPDLLPDIPEPGDTVGPVLAFAPLADQNLSTVTIGAGWDTRDHYTGTTRGSLVTLYAEQAGILGGDSDFTKLTLDYRFFHRLNAHEDVLAFRAYVGHTFGGLPLFEAFSFGGAYFGRGYPDDRFRGENMALFSGEYRYPISDNLSVVAFVDAGDAYGGLFPTKTPGFNIPAEDQDFNLHVGVGGGLRVKTPFGQVRLDLGVGQEGTQAHFSFGETF